MSVVLSSFRARMQQTERDLATEALKVTGGSVKTAARLVGLHHTQFRRIIVRHSLQGLLCLNPARSGNCAWRALGAM